VSSLLQVEHLNVSFATQTGEVAAVRDASFSIPESGTMGLVGESGSGKSATSRAIRQLLPPQARNGQNHFADADLLALPDNDVIAALDQHDLQGHDRAESGDAVTRWPACWHDRAKRRRGRERWERCARWQSPIQKSGRVTIRTSFPAGSASA
jgi:ABC-type glutathione transport system ATPase component